MKLNIGETVSELPEKQNAFATGITPLLETRGWNFLLENNPNRWVVLDIQDKKKTKKGGAFWTRAKNYNKRYYSRGYQFAVRTVEGNTTFFGRYSPDMVMTKKDEE
jgi:hypothetical protein|tara:strand:+ start:46 stop:363 length:318 start_codon:yes stop_codon:yes gene_type:complete